MKNKKLFLKKKVASASILLASKFYSTKMKKQSNKQGVLDYNCNVHLLQFNIRGFTFTGKRPYLHYSTPSCYLTPVILRVIKEICIEFSMHIADSDFKRIIRTAHHPWKLQCTSILGFQRAVTWPLVGTNMSLRTLCSSSGSLSRESVLSYQPHARATQAMAQFNSLESSEV